MYFHIIWIKEKNWKKYDLNILLNWWDEDFIRKFLAYRWVVIVSINQFKDDEKSFGNIIISTVFENTEISLLTKWENIDESAYFFMFLWLDVSNINYINKPVSEDEVKQLIDKNLSKINEENESFKKQQETEEFNEQKKYEESWIKDWLKILNSNIDRIEQVLKAWKWILSWSELKQLEDYLNEIKRIRLWTNFNKMAAIVLDVHALLSKAETQIFKTYESQKFLIDKNSSITNIEALSDFFKLNRISEKAKLQPAGLTTTESIVNMAGPYAIFLRLLRHDINASFKDLSFEDFFDIVIEMIEYLIITVIISISVCWLLSLLLGSGKFSLYLLPALWRAGLLIYLFINLKLKWIVLKLVWFFVMAIIYWRGLVLLLNTFAM